VRRLLVLLFLAAATPAAADTLPCDCDAACAGEQQPWATLAHSGKRLTFDEDNHRAWYENRFWRGSCDALSLADWGACKLAKQTDDRDWYDVMKAVLTHKAVAAADRGALCSKLIGLGQKIGFEWSKAYDKRVICTDDHLLPWFESSKTSDPVRFIERVERETHDLLAAKVVCGQ